MNEMNKLQKLSSFLATTILLRSISYPALADDNFVPLSTDSMSQITNVNELRDVAPTDWAYEALRSLVERYGCIVGYPNRTFRGDKPLSRWEFAAGLNACLNTLERLIQEGGVSKDDIDKLKRLAQEFQTELAALGAKIDNLEGRVSFLENHQFSTTTKLNGEVVFSIAGASTEHNQVVFQDRVRLELDTSFTGEDKLVTRLAAGNYQPFTSPGNNGATFSPVTTNAASIGAGGNNSVSVDWLVYYSPIKIGDLKIATYTAAFGGQWGDFVPLIDPYFSDGADGGNGAISSFAQASPIYRIGGGTGSGFNLKLGFLDNILGPTFLSAGFLSGPGVNNPNQRNTVDSTGNITNFGNGSYGILAQVNTTIANSLDLGFTYVNAYLLEGVPIFSSGGGGIGSAVTGTQLSNGLSDGTGEGPLVDSRKVINSYGVALSWKINKNITFNGFGNYSRVGFLGTGNGATVSGDGEIWSFGGGLALSDLGKDGSVLGLFAGVQPYYGNINVAGINGTYSTSMPVHVELFYKYPMTNNISITPGVIWISNPTQALNNNGQVIGVIRTTFTF